MSLFEWKNLPNGISSRFIEDKLFYNGLVIYFKSKNLGWDVVAQCAPIGQNDYEEPTGYHAYSVNKINEYVKPSECVPIWNDMFIEPNVANVNFFAKRLSNIQKTFDVNLEEMKNPYLIFCPETQKSSVQAAMKQKTDGVPYIYLSDDFQDLVKIQCFDLHIQNHTKELQEVKQNIMSEGLTFFGIDNVSVFKRERLTSGESDENDEATLINRNSMFKARKKAVEEINEKFGTNIDVEISSEVEKELNRFLGGGDGGAE
jgi:hypothetical protein